MRIGRTVMRWRRVIGAIVVVSTVAAFAASTRLRARGHFIDLFPSAHPYVLLDEQYPAFGGYPTITLMLRVKHGDIFNYETLNKLRTLTRALEWLPGIEPRSVLSLVSFRAVRIRAIPGGLRVSPLLYAHIPRAPAEMEKFKQAVMTHRGRLLHLISDDNRSALVIAQVNERTPDYGALYAKLRDLVRRNRDSDHLIYLTGAPVIRSYAYHYLKAIAAVFFISSLTMSLILYLILGSYSSWWVPLLTGLMASFWGLGFGGLMNYSFDPLMLVVPFILTARNLSHAIQWQRRYYRNLNRLEDRAGACVATTDEMFWPGLLAIAADVTGLVFISLLGIPALDELARIGTVWLAASIWTVFIFQPIVMSYLPVTHRAPGEFTRRWSRRLEDWGEALIEMPVTPGRNRRLLLSGSLVLLVAGGLAAAGVRVGYNTPGTPLYRGDSGINRDSIQIEKQFPIDRGWVAVTTPPFPDPQSVFSPRVLRVIDQLQAVLMRDSNVRQVVSFENYAKALNQKFHYNAPKYFATPTTNYIIGDFWGAFLYASAPGDMEDYLSSSHGTGARIQLFLRDYRRTDLARLVSEIERFQRARLSSDPGLARVHLNYLGGTAGLYAAADGVLYRAHLLNLSMVLACVFALGVLLFSSWQAGALFVFAGVLVNFVAFLYIRLAGMALTIDSLPIISLAIGLGVDFAIATLSAVRAEVAGGRNLDDAIRVALRGSGPGVLGTVLVMLGCLIPWLFSPVLFHQHMAALLAVLMVANIISAILILPALLAAWGFDFITRAQLRGARKTAPVFAEARVVPCGAAASARVLTVRGQTS